MYICTLKTLNPIISINISSLVKTIIKTQRNKFTSTKQVIPIYCCDTTDFFFHICEQVLYIFKIYF